MSKKNRFKQDDSDDGTRIYGIHESLKTAKVKDIFEVRCENCGCTNTLGSNYCNNCGNPLTNKRAVNQQKEKKTLCPICGSNRFSTHHNRLGYYFVCDKCTCSFWPSKK